MDTQAAKRMLQAASRIQAHAKALNFSRPEPQPDELAAFDALVQESSLRDTTRQLFKDRHYALAVEEAYKCLNNAVKSRSGLSTDGSGLMKNAFSLSNPVLKINALSNQSQRDQQLGYMEIFSGCMTGIRNPRAHEHQYLDEPNVALEMLAWANHLMRLVRTSKRSRARKKATTP